MKWANLVYYPGLTVSDTGLVKRKAWSVYKGKERIEINESQPKLNKDKHGDIYIDYYAEGRLKKLFICDLVWNGFYPDNRVNRNTWITHIDGNKRDNSLKNLKKLNRR